jgi:hypothetical protein
LPEAVLVSYGEADPESINIRQIEFRWRRPEKPNGHYYLGGAAGR